MYGKIRGQVAVNNLGGSDGMQVLDDYEWGFGEPGRPVRASPDAVRLRLEFAGGARLLVAAEFSGLSRGLETVIADRGM